MLVIAFVFPFYTTQPHMLSSTLAAVFLVQSWAPHNIEYVYAINPPSWSLSCEAFFYLLLPFTLPIARTLRPFWRWLIAGAWFGLTSLVVVYGATHVNWTIFAFVNPLVRSGEFVLGVVIALEMRRGWRVPALTRRLRSSSPACAWWR